MKVLVMGGTRFNGLALTKELVKHGHDVTVFNRGQSEAALPRSVRRLYGDRNNHEQLVEILKKEDFDVVQDISGYSLADVQPLYEAFNGRPVLIPGDGTTMGQIGHVDDEAKALRMAMLNPNTFGKRYNVTGKDYYTDEGYVDTFAKVVGVEPEKVFIPAQMMDDIWLDRVSLEGDVAVHEPGPGQGSTVRLRVGRHADRGDPQPVGGAPRRFRRKDGHRW